MNEMSHRHDHINLTCHQNGLMSTPQFYGVTTTGIYCRFGCPSRAPRPENVVYLSSHDEAQQVGLRPCKRCRPDQHLAPHEAFRGFVVTQLRALAEQYPDSTIRELAEKLSISPRQLERIVSTQTGLSPRAFLREQSAKQILEATASSSERITS